MPFHSTRAVSASLLAAKILSLALIAAVSMKNTADQHGPKP